MGLIEVHLHDAEFSFAPFSNAAQDTGEPSDTTDGETEENNDLYFPNDADASGGSSLGGLLVLVGLIVAALAFKKLTGGTEDLDDFGDDE